jgi:hypothetical protein
MTYAKRIIKTLGGIRPAARLLGLPASTVQSWGDRGAIPDAHKANIMRAARRIGKSVKPEDFLPFETAEVEKGAA